LCGRYAAHLDVKSIVDFFELHDVEYYPVPRYNIAPTQSATVIVEKSFRRSLATMRWGLKPAWAAPRAIINARGETLAEKRTFSTLLEQRCLVVASGYYEWVNIEGRKVPYYIHLAKPGHMPLAGLWQEQDGERRFAIITMPAQEAMEALHPRMPVVLTQPDEIAAWLQSPFSIAHNLVRTSAQEFNWHQVSPIVNSAQVDSELCIQRVLS